MPIKARIDMNATGIKTNVGVKVIGPQLSEIERISREVEDAVKKIPGPEVHMLNGSQQDIFLTLDPKEKR